MRRIAFSAIKGGVGKSSMAIMTANILAAAEKRVLCIDGDPQNSMSFYYLPDSQNMKESLADVFIGGDIAKNIVKTTEENISLIPSSLELFASHHMPYSLDTVLDSVEGEYDYCVIDTAPNFERVTANCLGAADIIVTPVQFSNFDYKSAVFYQNLLGDIITESMWKILFNKFKSLKIGGSIAAEYLQLYNNTFGDKILKSRIPDSVLVRQYFDTGLRITKAKSKRHVYDALTDFVSEITGEEIKPEMF